MNTAIDWSDLEQVIRTAERQGGAIGVNITASNGETCSYNGGRLFGAASTVKIPLMIELYRQIDRGERALDDLYILRDEDRAVGSGVMLELHAGMPFTLNDLIYLMISISDNTATNILIDYAGMEQTTATMRALGMTQSLLGRKMKGRPAEGDEQENWATPDDYAHILAALINGKTASADSTARMIAMLEKQQNHRRVARYLPESETLRFGSKTGSVRGVTNDVGFIADGDDFIIVSVFCEGLPDQHVGEQAIGDIARAAMLATGIAAPLMTS